MVDLFGFSIWQYLYWCYVWPLAICIHVRKISSINWWSGIPLNPRQFPVPKGGKKLSLHTCSVWELCIQKFWTIVAVEVLGWRSKSCMRSQLCVKWVPSHPTVSAFLLPESFNWFHGNPLTADLTSLQPVLYVWGTGNIFGREKTENMMKVIERKHNHKGLELFYWSLWTDQRGSDLILQNTKC